MKHPFWFVAFNVVALVAGYAVAPALRMSGEWAIYGVSIRRVTPDDAEATFTLWIAATFLLVALASAVAAMVLASTSRGTLNFLTLLPVLFIALGLWLSFATNQVSESYLYHYFPDQL